MQILLVEDDQSASRFVARRLREHSLAVDEAADGDQALKSWVWIAELMTSSQHHSKLQN